ncbi:MAG: hypothetical protein LBN95_03295 [Prevotellaceae bacterium]|nr:hypothetical protein [Prevotellaceae bacterium]
MSVNSKWHYYQRQHLAEKALPFLYEWRNTNIANLPDAARWVKYPTVRFNARLKNYIAYYEKNCNFAA